MTLAISTTSASNHQWALGWTGQLAVGRGGTGLASLTQGYIPFGKGTAAFGSSANLFWDETNSRLGIGTTGPGSMLDVRGGVEFNRTGAATVGDFSVSGDTAPNMYFGRLSPTTGDSTTFYFRSRLNQNKFRVNTAGSGNVSMNFETGGGGAFVIYGSTADSSERFRVTETGNVGIGTTSPGTARLYVSGGRIVADTNIEGA
ncbi:MAG: hypothetical protein FJW69_07430, partial [Actinobacteria bacterium]|nr:hypothetical protein [Actinomycetota bacterium]